MPDCTPDALHDALRGVLFPNFKRDVVTLGMVEGIDVDADTIGVRLRPGTDKPDVHDELRARVVRALQPLAGRRRIQVDVAGASAGRGRDPFAGRAALPGVRHVIAVASAKGGVGKSTVAANLAVALADLAPGRVGLLDADVYGPSVPIVFGAHERPRATSSKRLVPIVRHGVKLISMGFFLDEQAPVIWRGPIVMGIVRQFLQDVEWGETEFLLVDLPPGTGDAVLTLVQQVPVSGGVVVTTPQDVALLDVGRGIAMFRQVSTPIYGVVENMAGYVCPSCGTEDAIFGSGGAARLAAHFDVPLLGRVPIAPEVRVQGDAGVPIVRARPDQPASQALRAVAARVAEAARKAVTG